MNRIDGKGILQMAIEVDSQDDRVNAASLMEVSRAIGLITGDNPKQGAELLMAVACMILDAISRPTVGSHADEKLLCETFKTVSHDAFQRSRTIIATMEAEGETLN